MKSSPDALIRRLEQTLDSVYLVCGDEPFLAAEAGDAIRAAARAGGYTDREIHHAAARGFDWDGLMASGASMSLFSDKRVMDVRLPTGKPGDQGARTLVEWCKHPPPDTLLLVTAGKLESSARNSKWVKAFVEAGVMVEVWPLQGRALKQWVVDRMRSRGLQPHPEAVDLLTQRVEGNLLAGAQEIDKLSLLAGAGTVDVEAVRSSVADSARYDVYQLVDAALAGDSVRAIRMLDGLRAEGEAPTLVVWALARELRLVSGLAAAIERGESMDRVLHMAHVWERRKPVLRGALARLRPSRVNRLIERAAHADCVMKGAAPGEPWDELMGLTLSFAWHPSSRKGS